ncbi:MAG: imidazolonepropionase, partial [Planctomycetes bacterium]|nr:imidazolonepropionase [Planctomycetota bacterium]
RIHPNAFLYAEQGAVVAIGDPNSVEACVQGSPVEIDASGKTVIPGFVDPHTHAVFAGSRVDEFVRKIEGASTAEIAATGGGILSTMKAVRAASQAELKELSRARLRTALEHGTTTMEIKSGYGLDLENELKMLDVIEGLRSEQPVDLIATFLGAHAVPPGIARGDYLKSLLGMLPSVAMKAKFCDAFCDAAYFPVADTRSLMAKAKEHGLGVQLHAGQFAADGGVALGVELGAQALSHLDHISDAEIAALAASPTAAILLPGVSLFGGTPFPPARKLIDAGTVVAIATNFNPGSCPSLSMPMMVGLACMQMKMSPAEALNAATVNAAYALGLENLGTIEPGRPADLAILDLPDYRMLPYHFGMNPVVAVLKKGRLVWQR